MDPLSSIQLTKRWELVEQIGEGGFGKVYRVQSGSEHAVAKLVPKAAGANRELLFVDLKDVRNVIPIWESGETESHWVLLMPEAEMTLETHLQKLSRPAMFDEIFPVIQDILTALSDMQGRIVHRDIKPANILYWEGHWRLADFGISRYAEATTAIDTQKFAMSPAYAAPERWRAERATSSTDIYSVGILVYESLEGHKPFEGPTWEDYRHQHLHVAPAPMTYASPRIAAMVDEMLYKPADARPSSSNLKRRIQKYSDSTGSSASSRLQEANRKHVNKLADKARIASEEITKAERRDMLIAVAKESHLKLGTLLEEFIGDAAPSAVTIKGPNGAWRTNLGDASLHFGGFTKTDKNPWGGPISQELDVIAHSEIAVTYPGDRAGYKGRSHSLWFCNFGNSDQYAWYELAFKYDALSGKRSEEVPFCLEPGAIAAQAFSIGLTAIHLADRPILVELDDVEDLAGHWATWLADAYEGTLHEPDSPKLR